MTRKKRKNNMCAIKPLHKKRIIFDFYTVVPMTEKAFNELILEWSLREELYLNGNSPLRVHVKETEQEAD